MRKIILCVLTVFFSIYSQAQFSEGFESTTGPDALPSTNWTLGSGNWAVFDNAVGTGQRWGINNAVSAPVTVYQGTNAAYINREFIGQGNTSEDYLATPLVTIPANGQLHFYTRSFTSGNQGTLYQIKIAPSTATQTNPAAYSLVQQWTETELTTAFNIYEEKVVNLSAYAGQQVYISFVKVYTQPAAALDGDRWLLDNVCITQQCIDPTGLSATGITQTSANLSWANPSAATSWEIEILPAAGTPTGTGIIYNGVLPYVATATATGTSFTPATSYKYYVRALCSACARSLWVGPFSFATSTPGFSCTAPIVIGSLPYSTTDNTANYGDTTDVAQPATCAGTTTNYMTGNDVFYSYTPSVSGVISLTMTPSATWSGVFVYDGCSNIGVTCVAGVANTGSGVRSIPSINVIAGHQYIITISTNASPQTVGYSLLIQTVNCAQPATLTAGNITQTSAQLSWSNPSSATSWEVAVQTAGSPIPSGSGTQTNINTNYSATPLNSGTNYQYYVRSDCGNGTFSAWSGPFLFTTLANYCAGNNFYDTGGATGNYSDSANVTTTICPGNPGDQVTVQFNSFNLENNFDFLKIYDGNNATGTLLGNFTGTTIPPSFTSSAINGCLTFVFTSDSSITAAGWDATILCLPPPTCPRPTAIVFSNIGQAGVTIGWTEVGTATTWEVLLLATGSPTPLPSATGITTSNNPYTIGGLNPATSFDVYVRAKCSVSDISFWSIRGRFTTLIANDECTNAIVVPVNTTTTCTLTTSGSLVGATASTQGNTCAGTDDDDVWFKFTATSTQHLISLLNVTGSTTDLFHVLYTGSCGSLTQLYCSDANNSVANNLTIGQVYYIRVYSYTATTGQTSTFNVCIGTPIPPPTCINNQPAGNTCATATPICNLNGYCGSTSVTYTADYWSELLSSFCGTIENNSFLSFVATATTISFDVWVTSSQNNDGIQILIFSNSTCSGPINNLTCWSPGIVPNGSTNISANGLIIGNSYYIMIDGYAGDVCNYVIAANSGIQTQVNTTASDTNICLGETVNLGANGGNGSYVWTPATGLSATTGANITFTPTTSGTFTITATSNDGIALCPQDVSDSVTIVVNDNTTPTFNTFGPYCVGDTVANLPTTSNNGVTGTWSPSTINDTLSGNYTFTPTTGLCALPVTIPITVNPIVIPTFDNIPTLCYGIPAPSLPTISNNGVTGIWSPAIIDNTQSATYTFTPNTGQCATTTIKNIVVNQIIAPTFLSPAPICNGDNAPTLPSVSTNGITGTWTPAVVNNTLTTTYTFTPTPGQCASTTTMAITVYQDCSFGSFASAVWLTNCTENNFFNTVGSGTSIIGPPQNIFTNTDLGTYLSNSNTFKLRGAEVKTFKIATANVCSARLNYRIYPQSGTPGTFTVLDLPFFNNCVSGSFPSGGPCNPGDQKWQEVLSDFELPVDLTAFPAGDYVLEVFYDITGDVNSTTQCDDTILINNNGANFIASYTLQNQPGYFGIDATTCNGTDGSILITNLAPNTQYNISYEDDGLPVNSTINSTTNGDYSITGLNAGVYENLLVYSTNGCLIASGFSALYNPIITPTFDAVSPICVGQTLNALPTNSLEGIIGSWSPALNNLTTTTYTFTPNSSSTSTTNLIVNGDFSLDNTGFSTDYQYINNAGVNGVQKAYGIVTTANSWFQFFPACTGHLPTSGNIMVVDGSTSNAGNDKVWGQNVTVEPNKTYTFSYWLQTVATPNLAIIEVTINGISIGSVTAPPSNCQWAQHSFTWNSGSNTTAQIAIFDRLTIANGNDFSLDDITFTLNENSQCAESTTLTINVNQPTAATFNTIPAICSGGIAPTLPATSIEGFTGTWSPSIVDNAQTLTYTFTPTAGQCATTGSVVVTVTPNTTPVFAIGTNITACAGASLQVLLPTTSQNGITGTWNPSTLDYSIVGTTVYTFTPTTGLCATNTTLTAFIKPYVTPTFVQVPAICNGGLLNILPSTSIEGIIGTWTPAINNTATTIYTFTPTDATIGLNTCSNGTTMTITVNPNVTPTFNGIAPLCIGETAPSLPSSSIEGITGIWNPAQISNTASGNYSFVPTIGQCATNGSLSVTVQSGFDFEISGSCIDDNFILEVTDVTNSIDIATANFTWFINSGQSIGNNSNTFNVTEYLTSTVGIEPLPITFSVTVTNQEGCYRTEPITFDRVFCGIQKGISPNNDGDNEFFDLQLLNVKHLSIFNRYGMKVYSKGNYTNQWIGQSDKGDELPDGTYYYVIDFNDNLPAKTGWIYINREY